MFQKSYWEKVEDCVILQQRTKKKPAVIFSKDVQIPSQIGFHLGPPDGTDGVFTIISELHFQVSGIKKQAVVSSAFGFSYWINRSGGTQTSALCVDRSFSWFVSPAGCPEGPRLVKHSWVQAGIKAKVSFDGTSHFSMQQSALRELEGKWIVARAAHPAWVETTALSFITRASAGSAELSAGRWINCTER